jgi:hypothetical protein
MHHNGSNCHRGPGINNNTLMEMLGTGNVDADEFSSRRKCGSELWNFHSCIVNTVCLGLGEFSEFHFGCPGDTMVLEYSSMYVMYVCSNLIETTPVLPW